ncbi:MAG TPA: tRNA preQ1(34) S-adenosylmethionine ribosyltransferase-isomerase QueA [Dehalococcoidia bacterium]|nr:tRNA preQ1(34) S-adenosylmethionine ribosyltransferase-isomerase QueA [Dehalococcoidia bacterium]
MKISDFDYHLPPKLIAQRPVEPRDRSRLMILHRASSSIEHHCFFEIVDYLSSGDALVFNDSRVIPARLLGQKSSTVSKVEILLLRRLDNCIWETLVRPGRKVIVGTKINITNKFTDNNKGITAEVLEQGEGGIRVVHFSDETLLERLGEVPLPPYIHTPLVKPERYQTVYAKTKGSVAAPTAGLHFTPRLLNELQQKGVRFAFVTLHIGLDTFRPVRVDDPSQHPIHKEYGELSPEIAALLNQTKKEGKRLVAVGTSTVRLIEAATQAGTIQPFTGWVDLFILPRYRFRITDAMITNFHLPKSTLLMLVSAFAGTEFILQAYEQAKNLGYRFYSLGDAMLIS